MYARVTIGQIAPDQEGNTADVIRNALLPALREKPGFKGITVCGDRASGKGIALLYFATEEDATRDLTSPDVQQALREIGSRYAGTPERETYAVLVDERL